MKNKSDDLCIIWCLLAHKYYHTITHNKKSEVCTYKKYFNEIIQPENINILLIYKMIFQSLKN